jgi:hypothetical protein
MLIGKRSRAELHAPVGAVVGGDDPGLNRIDPSYRNQEISSRLSDGPI